MSAIDHTGPLSASGNLRRRRRVDRTMRAVATAAAVFAVAILVIVIYSIAQRGASQLSIGFLTKNPTTTISGTGGGIKNAIIGSGLIVALATAMALPLGVLIAIFLTEFSTPRMAAPIRLALDLLNGLPSIVIGVFVFGLIVLSSGETGFAGSFALSIIMLPLIARNTAESLTLVPQDLRDASQALGVSRWRTTTGVVIPSALSGILTGTVLAIARAAGETAPLLLTTSLFNPNATSFNIFGTSLPNIPLDIFNLSESGGASNTAAAWGAALVLMAFILVGSLSARGMLARSRRMMSR
jgi:phosphate transport system permease protein